MSNRQLCNIVYTNQFQECREQGVQTDKQADVFVYIQVEITMYVFFSAPTSGTVDTFISCRSELIFLFYSHRRN